MKTTALIIAIYGFFIGLGGAIGFMKAGSLVSLICGAGFGLILMITAYFISRGKIVAQYFALILTLLLDGLFTLRFTKSLQFFPSGFLSLLSLCVLITLALRVRHKNHGTKGI